MNELKELLISRGADLVGFADLRDLDINHEMPFGVSVGVKLSARLVESIHDGPNMFYFEEYERLNNLLDQIVNAGAQYLSGKGYKALPQTTTSISRIENYKTELPHKTVATRAGLGWIGKCCLLVTHEYGSAVRLSSLLTNAELDYGTPVTESLCENCMECAKNCPANAISGKSWNRNRDRSELIDVHKCQETARKMVMEKINKNVTLCGKCFVVCPYTMKSMK